MIPFREWEQKPLTLIAVVPNPVAQDGGGASCYGGFARMHDESGAELVLVKKHSRAIRWMHWINFPVLGIMIWSGLLILRVLPGARASRNAGGLEQLSLHDERVGARERRTAAPTRSRDRNSAGSRGEDT